MPHEWADWLDNPCYPRVLNSAEPGTETAVAHTWADWLHNLPSGVEGVPNVSKRVTKKAVAQKWVGCLHNPWHLRGPLRFTVGDEIISGPQVGRWGT